MIFMRLLRHYVPRNDGAGEARNDGFVGRCPTLMYLGASPLKMRLLRHYVPRNDGAGEVRND